MVATSTAYKTHAALTHKATPKVQRWPSAALENPRRLSDTTNVNRGGEGWQTS